MLDLSPSVLYHKLQEAQSAQRRDIAPYTLLHLAPKTLATFANALQQGFTELDGLLQATTLIDNASCPPDFSLQLHSLHRSVDCTLIEIHGAEQEVRIFEEVSKTLEKIQYKGKVVVLIHRPEEVLLRLKLENGIATAAAKRMLADKLQIAHAVVVLGKSGERLYREILPESILVTSIFHPYFAAHPLPTCPCRYHPDSVVAVGSSTTWGEMRDIADLESLMRSIGGHIRAFGYASGSFQSAHVDMPSYIARRDKDILFLGNCDILAAREAGLFSDEESFRQWLYSVSEEGTKLIIRAVIPEGGKLLEGQHFSTADPDVQLWESRLVDFNVQFYKENLRHLRDDDVMAPKQEFSGTLHKGLAEIFLVLSSPTMDDVENDEGMKMIHAADQSDFTEPALEVIRLVNSPAERRELLENNATVSERLGGKCSALGYFLLLEELLKA